MSGLGQRLLGVICAFGLLTAACASRVPPAVVTAAAPSVTPVTPPESRPVEPIAVLLERSSQHFAAGQRDLRLGDRDKARAEFNRALEVLLESPEDARADSRIRDQFNRLVERVSAFELTALAVADALPARQREDASFNDWLAPPIFDDLGVTDAITQAAASTRIVHDIDIPLNEQVLAYVELFTGRLRGYLTEGLRRGARFLPMIQDVLRADGLPLDLAYVPLIESAFKPSALSRAKAKGIWQFMQGTGLENGLKHDWYIDERAEPEKSTRAAAKYLKTLYAMFGDWHLALASYNGGPGRVQRAMKSSGHDDFWALSAGTRYLPKETRDYVPLILAAMIVARNPAQYGLDIEPLETPGFETVTLATATDIRWIAEWAHVPVETIQDLNPELRRWTTPVGTTAYELKVPEGTATVVGERLAEARPEQLVTLSRYTVKKGDTLAAVAKRVKVTRADLAEANYLSTSARLTAGQELVIPREAARLLTLNADTARTSNTGDGPDTVVATANVSPRRERAEPNKTTYLVRRGDTLYSIAKVFDTTVTALKSWNRLSSSALQIGQRLTLFPSRNTTH